MPLAAGVYAATGVVLEKDCEGTDNSVNGNNVCVSSAFAGESLAELADALANAASNTVCR